jgi:hypothetical protein
VAFVFFFQNRAEKFWRLFERYGGEKSHEEQEKKKDGICREGMTNIFVTGLKYTASVVANVSKTCTHFIMKNV